MPDTAQLAPLPGCRPVRKKISKRTRGAVYARDDWSCRDCGLRIEPRTPDEQSGRLAPSVPGLSIDEPYVWLELDHVVPVVLGGTNEPTNLQALCSPCNRRKSSHLVGAARA